ncbi:MAG: SMP-30/gluconolactonase/LRE family protein [Verrucomicrobiota bacterium]|nr:SMP-30/gluconolactonase/LRE family protein [Verrucomicrobiota bacterium]
MITTLINEHCELGENPLWNGDDGCLYWTDITGGKVHRFHLATRSHAVVYRGEPVGGFTFQANGDLLLFRVQDLALLHSDGRVDVLREFSDEGMQRFNDVIADPEGRVFAGTIGKTAMSGGLFRVELDGAITLLFRGTGCSNGMGFSPDLEKFYWTCSTRRQIYEFDYRRATGGISGERLLYQATPTEGIPDGMTVDRHGHLWSARWDGFAVVHHAADGRVLEKFPFPVAKVSSLCFGGSALDTFFVTTAGGVLGSPSEDGTVYQWAAGVQGAPEFKSRIARTGRSPQIPA